MASPISKTKHNVMHSTLRYLSDAGATTEHADWMRRPGNAKWLVDSINERIRIAAELAIKNPFEMSLDAQITALRNAIKEECWQITEEEIANLIATAPEWPKGRDTYRVFDICWGEGRAGMIQTFEAHAARFKRVHPKNLRWELLLSGDHKHGKENVDRLRLLAGNDTHKPCVKWAIVDLQANRKRLNITDVRDPNSLAQVGIILGWLFPKRVEAIDYKEWCAWFCGGYELNVPESGDGSWRSVPCVNHGLYDGTSYLNAFWPSNGYSGYSVPVTQECQH